MTRALVVGLGAADRGDDGIGPVVVGLVRDALEAHRPAAAERGGAPSGAFRADPPQSPSVGSPPVVAIGDGAGSEVVMPEVVMPEVVLPEVVVHEDPTALVELMAGRPLAVIVDALRSPGQAGSVQVIEAGQSPLPASTDPGPAGSHGFGLASSLELARALGCLPPRVVVVGVVGTGFSVGAPLSERVARAVPLAVAEVLRLLAQPPVGSSPEHTADGRSPGSDADAARGVVRHVH